MTGIPDAVVEAAAKVLHYGVGTPRAVIDEWWSKLPEVERLKARTRARSILGAAEGPWREHLATELEAVAEGIETNDLQYESGQRWAFWEAARIVRGTNAE